MGRKYNQPLTFEEYLYYCREPISQDLNTKQLKQILFIHGLETLSDRSKEEMIGAVRLLRLIPPARSTVNCYSAHLIPTGAESTPSLEEVKKDIRDIEWQECPVGSVASVGPAVLGMSCSMPDDSSSLKSSLKLNVPLGLYKEGGGIISKRVRGNKKKKKTPLLLHSGKLEQKVTKVIHVAESNSKDADDHLWVNKGSQLLKGFLIPRMYYRCKVFGCPVVKHVDHDTFDPSVCIISYKGEHQH